MSYCIMRAIKVKTAADLKGLEIHNERLRDHSNSNPDINFEKSKDNYQIGRYTGPYSYIQRIDRQIKERYKTKKAIRKDATRCIELIFTSDMEFFQALNQEQEMEFFKDCYAFAERHFGGRANIISDSVHKDEETPHMHLDIVPLTADGRLSAKEFLGGKKELQTLQDSFHAEVGSKWGLERGTRANLEQGESGRRHKSVRELKKETENQLHAKQKELTETLLKQTIQNAFTVQARQEESDIVNKIKELQENEQSLNSQIANQQTNLKSLQEDAATLQQHLSELKNAIANRESVIRQRNKILQEQDTRHKKQNKEIDSLNSQIARKRSELADMERLAGEVAEKRQAVAELDRHISDRREELSQLNTKMTGLKAQEQSLSSQIALKRSKLAESERLAGEVEQKRQAVTELVRHISERREELSQLNTKMTGLKAQEQSLSSQIALKRSKLAESERLAGEVEQKRQAVTELDRHISDRREELLGMADITEEEMQLIKSDSIAHNLVQKAIWATCEFLGAQGMLRVDNWRTAAVTANNPVLAQLKDPMTGFLQKVKEHMRKSINSLAKKKRKGR